MPAKKNLAKEFTTSQAARLLRVSRQTIWSAIKKGRLKARRIGHMILINRSALDRYKSSPKPVGGRPKKT
ncbi:MAG: helix-turn-helix domain-containing protein [Deltaproteobacteria bacterium]|nr:helix-turn-helix domain-containing protein [Deltaproteobacteria bacterium]